MFNGGCEGFFTALTPDRIEMDWRMKEFPNGHYSKVVIELTEPDEAIVRLELTHTGVPEDDKYGNHDIPDRVKAGWEDKWFGGIHKVMGYAKVARSEL